VGAKLISGRRVLGVDKGGVGFMNLCGFSVVVVVVVVVKLNDDYASTYLLTRRSRCHKVIHLHSIDAADMRTRVEATSNTSNA
jgi:hypothetical protein